MKRFGKIIGNLLIMASLVLSGWWLVGTTKAKDEQKEWLEAFDAIKVEASSGQSVSSGAKRASGEEKEGSNGIEGVLSIPQIDLKSPVLHGADPATLDKALGSIANMDVPGEMNGSYAIAGHQAHVFGQFFNRLHELEEGAHFNFETIDETMDFVVTDIHIVKPEEVEILNRKKGVALLSLITCYPAHSNKYRLVVQAERADFP